MARIDNEMHYKSEEKRRRILIIAIALLFIGVFMILIGSYAFYQSTLSGTVNVTMARWDFKANNQTSSFSVALTPTQSSTTLNSTIAPGTSGTIPINLTATNSDLDVDYTITFSNFSNVPTNLVFKVDNVTTNIRANGYSITSTLAAGGSTSKTITWEWPYGNSSSVTADNADADKSMSFTINVVGQQVQ